MKIFVGFFKMKQSIEAHRPRGALSPTPAVAQNYRFSTEDTKTLHIPFHFMVKNLRFPLKNLHFLWENLSFSNKN